MIIIEGMYIYYRESCEGKEGIYEAQLTASVSAMVVSSIQIVIHFFSFALHPVHSRAGQKESGVKSAPHFPPNYGCIAF